MTDVLFAQSIDPILDTLDFSKLGNTVAIKVHFGEKGCTTYINPELVRKVYNKIISLGKSATLVECNVLYRGSRINTTDHIKTARSHGFDMPIDILDGEYSQEFWHCGSSMYKHSFSTPIVRTVLSSIYHRLSSSYFRFTQFLL